MSSRFDLPAEDVSEAMLRGLTDHVRAALRKRIMDRIEPDVDAAVEAGLATFEAAIQAHCDPMQMRDTIQVILKDRRSES
jgi:hypothetical protein